MNVYRIIETQKHHFVTQLIIIHSGNNQWKLTPFGERLLGKG
jgi:hypothetical protein